MNSNHLTQNTRYYNRHRNMSRSSRRALPDHLTFLLSLIFISEKRTCRGLYQAFSYNFSFGCACLAQNDPAQHEEVNCVLRWYGYPYAPVRTVKHVDETISEGTWLDSTGSYQNHELPIPSNVTRISQAIKPLSSDGIEQVIYYQVSPTHLYHY